MKVYITKGVGSGMLATVTRTGTTLTFTATDEETRGHIDLTNVVGEVYDRVDAIETAGSGAFDAAEFTTVTLYGATGESLLTFIAPEPIESVQETVRNPPQSNPTFLTESISSIIRR